MSSKKSEQPEDKDQKDVKTLSIAAALLAIGIALLVLFGGGPALIPAVALIAASGTAITGSLGIKAYRTWEEKKSSKLDFQGKDQEIQEKNREIQEKNQEIDKLKNQNNKPEMNGFTEALNKNDIVEEIKKDVFRSLLNEQQRGRSRSRSRRN